MLRFGAKDKQKDVKQNTQPWESVVEPLKKHPYDAASVQGSSKDQVKIFNGLIPFLYKVKTNELQLREEPLHLPI